MQHWHAGERHTNLVVADEGAKRGHEALILKLFGLRPGFLERSGGFLGGAARRYRRLGGHGGNVV